MVASGESLFARQRIFLPQIFHLKSVAPSSGAEDGNHLRRCVDSLGRRQQASPGSKAIAMSRDVCCEHGWQSCRMILHQARKSCFRHKECYRHCLRSISCRIASRTCPVDTRLTTDAIAHRILLSASCLGDFLKKGLTFIHHSEAAALPLSLYTLPRESTLNPDNMVSALRWGTSALPISPLHAKLSLSAVALCISIDCLPALSFLLRCSRCWRAAA